MLFILHTHTHTSSWPFRDCHEPLQVATHSGWTPLMAAAYGGHLSTVVYLMVAIEPPPPQRTAKLPVAHLRPLAHFCPEQLWQACDAVIVWSFCWIVLFCYVMFVVWGGFDLPTETPFFCNCV